MPHYHAQLHLLAFVSHCAISFASACLTFTPQQLLTLPGICM